MKLLDWLARLFFVPKCPFCGGLLAGGEGDGPCRACRDRLPFLHGRAAITRCRFTEKCVSPLPYRDSVRRAVCRYKFKSTAGTGIYHRCFAGLLFRCVQEHYAEERFDLITWVPVSARRKRERGYDQSQLLAEELGRRLQIPAAPLLVKCADNRPNSGIRQAERRRANVEGVYKTAGGEIMVNRTILLVDDVITTGATLSECAKTLLMDGAAAVYGLTVAKAK